MDPVRFGIIACSSVARRRFLPALAGASNARLERIGSRDPAKAELFARELGCAKFGTYEDVLADPQIEAVYISTPPGMHYEWVCRAAESRKHIWCEKPAFTNLDSARDAVGRCRRAGVRLMEGYPFLNHPQHARARELLTTHRLGEPRLFHAELTYPRPPDGDIRLQPALLGGVFHDSAAYPVAAALAQMPGEPLSAFCQIGMDEAAGVDDRFSLWLRFSTGPIAQMFVAFGTHYRSRYSVLGTRGRFELLRAFSVPPQMSTTLWLELDDGEEKFTVEPADQFRLLLDEFAAELRGQAPARPYEANLLRRQLVMDAAARSSRSGQIVEIGVV